MSLLNKIAALVGLIAGGTATWALLRYYPGPTPELVCLKADFPGDTCEFWVRAYGQDPCANCAMTLPDDVYTVDPIDPRLALFERIIATPIVQDTRPEWIKRLSKPEYAAVYAEWYRSRHHCADTWIGMPPPT